MHSSKLEDYPNIMSVIVLCVPRSVGVFLSNRRVPFMPPYGKHCPNCGNTIHVRKMMCSYSIGNDINNVKTIMWTVLLSTIERILIPG